MINKLNIAIDGPACSGKTTISKLLFNNLGYQFLDSDLLYRHFCLFYQNLLNKKQNFSNFPIKKKQIDKWQENFISNWTNFIANLEKKRAVELFWN